MTRDEARRIAVSIAKLPALRLYRLGKDMGERKDNRMCFRDRSGVLSVLGRAVCSWFRVSSAAGFLAIAPFSFTVGGGTAGDEVAFSAGLGTELSEVGSADDVITPKRAVSFRHEVDHCR